MTSSNEEFRNKLLKQRDLIYCLEGDNLSKKNEQRVQKINDILAKLGKNQSGFENTRHVGFHPVPIQIENKNIHGSPSNISIDPFNMEYNRRKEPGYGGSVERKPRLQNMYQRLPLSSIIRKTNEEIFIEMCKKIKTEKINHPNLFHYITNISPGSLEFKISEPLMEIKYELNRRSNLRNEKKRDTNNWWYTVSSGTKNNPDNQKRWLLIPPDTLGATDISDYCKNYKENAFIDLFNAIKDLNTILVKRYNIQYTISTEGLKEDILHIRFTPFNP